MTPEQKRKAEQAAVNKYSEMPNDAVGYHNNLSITAFIAGAEWQVANPPEVSGDVKERAIELSKQSIELKKLHTGSLQSFQIGYLACASDMAQQLRQFQDAYERVDQEMMSHANHVLELQEQLMALQSKCVGYEGELERKDGEIQRLKGERIDFAEWVGANGYVHTADDEWEDRHERVVAANTFGLLDLFRKETGRE